METQIAKIPPHQIEAEQSLLGGLLNDNSGIPGVIEMLVGDEFYRDSHRQIYDVMKYLHAKNETADIVTVTNELDNRKQIESVGGASYIVGISDWVLTAKNALTYARIIKDKALARRVIQSGNEITLLSYEGRSSDDILQIAKHMVEKIEENKCFGIAEDGCGIKAGMKSALQVIEERIKLKGQIPGIETGFERLDRLTCGMFPQDMWVVAGRPGQGKTALALNITRHVAGKGIHVLWFSLDMSKIALWDRLICTESRVNLAKIRSGNLQPVEHSNVIQAACELQHLPVTILDNPASDLDIVRQSKAIQPGLVVIDHLTKVLVTANLGSVNNNYGAVSKAIKNLAKDMNIPILLLCQLSRLNERENRAPKESDLRDTGEIEQDADTIIFIHSANKALPDRDLIIAKQRQGELAVLKFEFYGDIQKFQPLVRD